MGSSTNTKIKTGDVIMGGISRITAAEREALALFDAMIDAEPMTADDFRYTAFVEDLLFPELAKKREHIAAKYARQKRDKQAAGTWEAQREKARKYQEENRERIKARRAAHYQKHKAEILAKQKEYQQANRHRRNEWQRERRHNALAAAADALPIMA